MITKTVKPATELVNGLQNVEQLGGPLDHINAQTTALRKHLVEKSDFQTPLIVQRDNDGMFDVVNGDQIAGPFPTISFAMQIATGEKPANIRNDVGGKFRRFRVVREVLDA
jgi:hypothetical protein